MTSPLQLPLVGGLYIYKFLSDYNLVFGASDGVIFQAKACSSVHIGLFEYQSASNFYEIILDKTDGYTIIRNGMLGATLFSAYKPDVLNCDKYITLMVNWRAGGTIEVAKQLSTQQWEVVIHFKHTGSVMPINFVGLTTGLLDSGYFKM